MYWKLLIVLAIKLWACNCIDFDEIPMPPQCAGQPIGYKIKNLEDCASYILCHEPEAYKLTCARGTIFNFERQSCVPGTCIETPITTTPTIPTTPLPNFCQGAVIGYKKPYGEDCRAYFVCYGNTYEIGYCNEGLVFSEMAQGCVPGECRSPLCKGQKPNYMVAVPTDCSRYVLCLATTSEELQCPPGTIFNQALQRCVTGSCEISTINCLYQPNGKIIPDPQHCRLFWQCVEGHAKLRFCEIGTWFDREKNVCNFPQYVKNCPAAIN